MRIGNIIVALCILLFTEAQGEVLLRTTFEDYEGEPWENGWVREPEDSIYVRREAESQDYYQTQAHGRQSLYIYDPNSSTYSNVKHEFPDIKAGEEYMVEFYLWVPSEDQNGMYLYKPTIEGDSADIQLLLHSVNERTMTIYVVDKNGRDSCYLEGLDEWHKIQIHKRTNSTIDLYFNGKKMSTYVSLSNDSTPDTFLLGTEISIQDGEAFFDDFIITTPPTGTHPRLFFGPDDIDTLQKRADDTTLTSVGVSYNEIAESLISDADSIIKEKYFTYRYSPDWKGKETLYFPYPQPPDRKEDPNEYWTGLWQYNLSPRLQTLSFAYILTDSLKYAERTKDILISLSSWKQWTDPSFTSESSKYGLLDAAHTTLCVALAYDMIFFTMDIYEKMTVQNALLTLGIGQLYLDACHGIPSLDKWYDLNFRAVKMSSLGLASLAVYDGLSPEAKVAQDRLNALLNNTHYCDRNGGWFEGILYGSYVTSFITLFAEAYRMVFDNNKLYDYQHLHQFPYWRLYNLIPGGNTETLFEDSAPHGDYVPIFLLASLDSNRYAQWFLKQTRDVWRKTYIDYPSGSISMWLTYAPFLFLDSDLDVSSPENLCGNYSPYGRHFKDIGWVDLRTGWDRDNFLLAFKSGRISTIHPYYGFSHLHLDNNNFLFGKGYRWLISGGGYFSKDSEYHNVVLINGEGQRRVDGREIDGKIDKFYVCEDYGYLVGNAGNCYDHTELHTFQRNIVLLNNQKYFVVYDKLEANNPVNIDWLLHPGAPIQSIGRDYLTIGASPDCVLIKILTPSNVEINVIDDPTPNTIHAKENSVRSTRFLSVFYPFGEDQIQPVVEKIDGITIVGAMVAGSVVMFGKYDSVEIAEYELFNLGHNSVFNVLVDLVPNSTYKVFIRDPSLNLLTMIDTLRTTGEGTLSFEIDIGEGRNILISRKVTPWDID